MKKKIYVVSMLALATSVAVVSASVKNIHIHVRNTTKNPVQVSVLRLKQNLTRERICDATFGLNVGTCVHKGWSRWSVSGGLNPDVYWDTKTAKPGEWVTFEVHKQYRGHKKGMNERVAAIRLTMLNDDGTVEHMTQYTYAWVFAADKKFSDKVWHAAEKAYKQMWDDAVLQETVSTDISLDTEHQSDHQPHLYAPAFLYQEVPSGGRHKPLGSLLQPENKKTGKSGIMVEKKELVGKKPASDAKNPDVVTTDKKADITTYLQPVRQKTKHNWWFPKVKK